jgi:hypothetical protein
LAVQYWAESEAQGLPLAPWLRALLPLVYGSRLGHAFAQPTWTAPAS